LGLCHAIRQFAHDSAVVRADDGQTRHLLNAHEVVPPTVFTRIAAICAEFESTGTSTLAADLRQQLAANQAASAPPPKNPWWRFGG
jgi:hypothetical protein